MKRSASAFCCSGPSHFACRSRGREQLSSFSTTSQVPSACGARAAGWSIRLLPVAEQEVVVAVGEKGPRLGVRATCLRNAMSVSHGCLHIGAPAGLQLQRETISLFYSCLEFGPRHCRHDRRAGECANHSQARIIWEAKRHQCHR